MENSWDEIELKGPLRQKQTQQQNKKKKEWASSVGLCLRHVFHPPPRELSLWGHRTKLETWNEKRDGLVLGPLALQTRGLGWTG